LQEAQIGSALLPAFWPVIQPGNPGWRELQSNHLYGQMKNMPYMYHNGGLWPMLTGLEVMGLVRHGAWERNTWAGVPQLASLLIKRFGAESPAGRCDHLRIVKRLEEKPLTNQLIL
jgi:hypothetical protein